MSKNYHNTKFRVDAWKNGQAWSMFRPFIEVTSVTIPCGPENGSAEFLLHAGKMQSDTSWDGTGTGPQIVNVDAYELANKWRGAWVCVYITGHDNELNLIGETQQTYTNLPIGDADLPSNTPGLRPVFVGRVYEVTITNSYDLSIRATDIGGVLNTKPAYNYKWNGTNIVPFVTGPSSPDYNQIINGCATPNRILMSETNAQADSYLPNSGVFCFIDKGTNSTESAKRKLWSSKNVIAAVLTNLKYKAEPINMQGVTLKLRDWTVAGDLNLTTPTIESDQTEWEKVSSAADRKEGWVSWWSYYVENNKIVATLNFDKISTTLRAIDWTWGEFPNMFDGAPTIMYPENDIAKTIMPTTEPAVIIVTQKLSDLFDVGWTDADKTDGDEENRRAGVRFVLKANTIKSVQGYALTSSYPSVYSQEVPLSWKIDNASALVEDAANYQVYTLEKDLPIGGWIKQETDKCVFTASIDTSVKYSPLIFYKNGSDDCSKINCQLDILGSELHIKKQDDYDLTDSSIREKVFVTLAVNIGPIYQEIDRQNQYGSQGVKRIQLEGFKPIYVQTNAVLEVLDDGTPLCYESTVSDVPIEQINTNNPAAFLQNFSEMGKFYSLSKTKVDFGLNVIPEQDYTGYLLNSIELPVIDFNKEAYLLGEAQDNSGLIRKTVQTDAIITKVTYYPQVGKSKIETDYNNYRR